MFPPVFTCQFWPWLTQVFQPFINFTEHNGLRGGNVSVVSICHSVCPHWGPHLTTHGTIQTCSFRNLCPQPHSPMTQAELFITVKSDLFTM